MRGSVRTTVLVIIAALLVGLFVAWWYSGFSLDFSRFFASEPLTPAAQQNMVSCGPASQTVAVGVAVTLAATGGNGTYAWFAPGVSAGNINGRQGQSITFSYATKGTKKVTVQSGRADGSNNIDSVACTVIVQ